MSESKLDILKSLGSSIEACKNVSIPNEYWEREQNEINRIKKENDKFDRSISTSGDKFRQNFSL